MKIFFLFLFFIIMPETLLCQETTETNFKNLSYKLIPQYELPKQYIIDGQTKLYPKENPWRRGDIVFFLSIPATYFIVQNLLNLFNTINISFNNYNSALIRDNLGFTGGEWGFVIASILLIPMGVTIYDAVYIRDYPLLPNFEQREFKEIRMNLTIYRIEF
ncbi:MAG: hypothetical protein ACRCVW_03925 [Brevinema sp.]